MGKIKVLDKEFEVFIPEAKIQESIKALADRINNDYKDKDPIFVAVLNGAFIFASDLFKNLTIDCQISFTKIASYSGTQSTGEIKTLIGLTEDITNKHIVIIEDIVDTGHTLASIMEQINLKNPASIKIATLLFKPNAYKKQIPIDYVAFEIPNDFILGYGLDYDGYGRNTKDIYVITK